MRRAFLIVATLLFSLTFSHNAGAERPPAGAVIDGLHGALLSAMKDAEALGYEGRRAHLEPVVGAAFDVPAIARASVGKRWKKLSEAERRRLVESIGRLTVAVYAARFDSYAGERFRTIAHERAPRKGVMVHTQLVPGEGKPIRLNYLMRESETGWRIVDVLLQGAYSEVHMRRSQFDAVFRRDGFEGLMAAIEAEIARFEGEGAE